MGANWSSLEDMKNDPDLRNMLKSAIQGTITQASDYQTQVTQVEAPNMKDHQVGINKVDTDNKPLIGNPDKPIVFKQTTNSTSVVKTMFISDYLHKQQDPYITTVTYDLAGLSQEDAADKELPNWYDPKYIMEALGYQIEEASFDFDSAVEGINYKIQPTGESSEDYKKRIIDNFNKQQAQHAKNKKWNEDHATNLKYFQDKQKQLEDLQKQLDDIVNSDSAQDLKDQLAKTQQQKQNAQSDANNIINRFCVSDLWLAYQSIYLLKDKDDINSDYKINANLDETVAQKLNIVGTDPIFTKTYMDLYKKYNDKLSNDMKQANPDISQDDIDKKINKTSFMVYLNLYFDSDYNTQIAIKYGSSFGDFQNKIREFLKTYSEYQSNARLTALQKLAEYSDASVDSRKEFLPGHKSLCKNKIAWQNVKDWYDEVKNDMNLAASMDIEYNNLIDTYTKSHADAKKKMDDLQTQIDQLNDELNTQDAKDALTVYQYWDTDEITQDLVYKIRDDKVNTETQFDSLWDDKDEAAAAKDMNDKQASMFFAQSDISYWEMVLRSSAAFQAKSSDIAAAIKKNDQENGDDNVKNKLNIVLNSDAYKKALDDYNKSEQSKHEITYDATAEVVLFANDDTLTQQYVDYMNAYQDWYDSQFGIDSVVNHDMGKKWNKNNKSNIDTMNDDYDHYKTSQTNYDTYHQQYLDAKNAYKEKYGDHWNQVQDMNNKLNQIKTAYNDIKSIWDSYDDVINNKMKFISFNELYDIFTSGFVQKISEKTQNFTDIRKNIVQNVTESANLYSMNLIKVSGRFADSLDVNQSNNLIQTIEHRLDVVADGIDNIKNLSDQDTDKKTDTTSNTDNDDNDDNKDNTDNGDKDDKDKDDGLSTIIIVVIVLSALFVIGIIIITVIIIKRRNKNAVINILSDQN